MDGAGCPLAASDSVQPSDGPSLRESSDAQDERQQQAGRAFKPEWSATAGASCEPAAHAAAAEPLGETGPRGGAPSAPAESGSASAPTPAKPYSSKAAAGSVSRRRASRSSATRQVHSSR